MPKICLNMIVKNESKIIKRFLDSVVSLIDGYCICDTGSTDNTCEIIQTYFKEKNMPGKLVEKEFIDFATNRNFALEECHSLTDMDYILLLDADMKLNFGSINIQQFKNDMNQDAYFLFQGNDGFLYKNIRIVRNTSEYSYWGVTHEYMNIPNNCKSYTIQKSDLFIHDIGDGGAKNDKFARDIRLLKKGLENDPNSQRYLFYLANSYLDSGQYQGAIDTYKKRIQVGGWKEEVWYCYYSIGRAYKMLYSSNNMYNANHIFFAIHYWMEAYDYYPNRIENLYEIVKFYREQSKYNMAYQFYLMADYQRKHHYSDDHLFHEKSVYEYKLDYELSVMAFYVKPQEINIQHKIHELLSNHLITDYSIFQNILSNYKFYTYKLCNHDNREHPQNKIQHLCVDFLKTHPNFSMSTPSLCYLSGELVVNVRFVNYKITDQGEYVNQNNIISKNVLYFLDSSNYEMKKQIEIQHNREYDDLYVGLEDIKLINIGDVLHYSCNRGINANKIQVEYGSIDNNGRCDSKLLKLKGANSIEKNWVFFEEKSSGKLQFIYNWYPLQIGNFINDQEGENYNTCINIKLSSPSFFKHIRGSTNGVYIGHELWFLCHVVSYENRRFYYHLFVVLDSTNEFKVKKYSQLFTFDGHPVEYTTGFVYDEDKKQFLIGYSTNDSTTKCMNLNKRYIDNLFIE